MKEQQKITRNNFFKLSLGLGAGVLVSKIPFAKNNLTVDQCTTTPILELGPYPVMQHRQQPDHDIDLTKIKGHAGIAQGKVLIVSGTVKDKDCNIIQGAVVEIWQTNHFGKYRHEYQDNGTSDPNFQGWGQAITNAKGEYRFTTVVPGLYASRARHIHFKISKRGYHELITQLYFEGEERNKKDGILNNFSHDEQLQITKPIKEDGGKGTMQFNIVIEKLKAGVVSEKVLKEYIGKYKLTGEKNFNFSAFTKNVTGKEFKNVTLQLMNDKEQLYMLLPFSPKTEIGWNRKDEFQSWAFYNTFIRFQRNEKGKVIGLRLHFGEDSFTEWKKMQ